MKPEADAVLEAAIKVLLKHGIRRTSMNDIAEAAGVSRQTLYSRFENKEGIVTSVIDYVTSKAITEIEQQWQSGDSIDAGLDAFFQHALVNPYSIMQSMPDAADLFTDSHPLVTEAAQRAEGKYTTLLRGMLQPYKAQLQTHGESVTSFATFISATGYGIKCNATSMADLKKKLVTLRRLVLLMLTGNQQ